jgi:hypothetical protein
MNSGIAYGLRTAASSRNGEDFQRRVQADDISGVLDAIRKEATSTTRLQAYSTARELDGFYTSIFTHLFQTVKDGELPPLDDPGRDEKLAAFWQEEPMLAGAVYSMSAKMTALRWTITGPKDLANYYAQILSSAVSMGPQYDWGSFISATAQDFYTTNRGVFWETARDVTGLRTDEERAMAKLTGLAHIDALNCWPTGSSTHPVRYESALTGQRLRFRPWEVLRFTSLNSPREERMGRGYCAVDRAYKAAQLLLGLHKYDSEKLANLPPEGVAAVTGLTQEDFQDALTLWRAARKQNDSLTFPQILWLIGSVPNAEVNLDFIGFSQLPESFDRRIVVEQYINQLALTFGVDAREFWPISTSSLGTAAESEIQHLKAKGKGPGEFISLSERRINGELEEGVVFAWDTQDIAEDLQQASVAKAWVEALLPLTQGAGGPVSNTQGGLPTMNSATSAVPNKPVANQMPNPQVGPGGGEPFLTREQFLRILADKGVLPNYLVDDDRKVVFDSSIQQKSFNDTSDPIIITWSNGILSARRLPAYTLQQPLSQQILSEGNATPVAPIPAQVLKEGKIRGKPIPEDEATRGNAATVAAVLDEIERWRNNPKLAGYVPGDGEDAELQKIISNVRSQVDI